jgi:hypothetical protein
MSSSAPFLSVVVTARNDDHGGNLLGRMQAFVNNWIAQSSRHGIRSELVLVEWNPPANRPRLVEALRWPKDRRYCETRIIEAPEALHRQYKHAATLPLYQMIAKNAGIRRAKGRFVLATNIDILFSDELCAFLTKESLQPDRMYRIDRHDVMNEVPVDSSPEEQLAYCRSHLIRVNRRHGSFVVTPDGRPTLHATDIAPSDSGLAFGAGWYPPERDAGGECFRWAGESAEVLIEAEARGALVFDIEPGPGTGGRVLQMEAIADDERLGTIAAESRSRVRLSLGQRRVSKITLRVLRHGTPLPSDSRVLSFRAAAFEWQAEFGNKALHVQAASVGGLRAGVNLWHLGQHVIARLAHDGPLVTFMVPVSPRLQRILRYYVRNRGITGMVRSAVARLTGHPEPPIVPAAACDNQTGAAPALLHTNACGDFTLLARQHWLDLRGYPEFDLFSMNLDSVFCFSAHYGGATEETLSEPMRIYHIEHSTGSGWTPEGQAQLYERLKTRGLSFVDNAEVLGWASQMSRLRSPMIFNLENWGLSEFELPETVIPTTLRD